MSLGTATQSECGSAALTSLAMIKLSASLRAKTQKTDCRGKLLNILLWLTFRQSA